MSQSRHYPQDRFTRRSAFASEEILEQLIEFKSAEKPLIISIGSVAASGGYWIAMAGDKIFASEVSIQDL